MDFITGFIAGGVIVGIIAIFVYRKNVNKLGPIADKIDVIYDKIEDKIKKD